MPVISRLTIFLTSNIRPYLSDSKEVLIPSGDAARKLMVLCGIQPKSLTFVLYFCSYHSIDTGSYFCPQCIGDAVENLLYLSISIGEHLSYIS